MSSSNGVVAQQRNSHNASTMLKRRSDKRGWGVGFGDSQEDRIPYAPPRKRPRSQSQFGSGVVPLYHHGSNMSRVSNYGDVNRSNPSDYFPLRNNDCSPLINTDHQKPFGYGNPNPQFVDDLSFDSLPEWVPNQSNFPISSLNHVAVTNRDLAGVPYQSHVFTNFPNSMSMNHSNMIPTVSQAMSHPTVVSKGLSDFLSVLNGEKDKSEESPPLGIDFDSVKLNVRRESVIKSLYSDMPRQCSSCGLRFKTQEDHSNHMDWHVRKNRTAKDANKTNTRVSQKPKQKSRQWFASSSVWLSGATGGTTGAPEAFFKANGETQKKEEEQKRVVPADENQKCCALCIEPFEEFFSHEDDDWMYKDAVYLKNGSGPIVHAKCMPEPRKAPAKDSRQPMVKSVTVPSAASALVC